MEQCFPAKAPNGFRVNLELHRGHHKGGGFLGCPLGGNGGNQTTLRLVQVLTYTLSSVRLFVLERGNPKRQRKELTGLGG